jgi:hypothetical protein
MELESKFDVKNSKTLLTQIRNNAVKLELTEENLTKINSDLLVILQTIKSHQTTLIKSKEDETIKQKLLIANIEKEQREFLVKEQQLKKEAKQQKKIDKRTKKQEKKSKKAEKRAEGILEGIKSIETRLYVEIFINGQQFLKVINYDNPRTVPKFRVEIATSTETPIIRFLHHREIEELIYKTLKLKPSSSLLFRIVDQKSKIILKSFEGTNLQEKSFLMDHVRHALSYIDKELITRDY